MERTLKISQVFILFCTRNASKSKSVEGEWEAAYQLSKTKQMKIIPVCEKQKYIPALLKPIINVEFTKENFEKFIENLYKEILRRKLPKNVKLINKYKSYIKCSKTTFKSKQQKNKRV